ISGGVCCSVSATQPKYVKPRQSNRKPKKPRTFSHIGVLGIPAGFMFDFITTPKNIKLGLNNQTRSRSTYTRGKAEYDRNFNRVMKIMFIHTTEYPQHK